MSVTQADLNAARKVINLMHKCDPYDVPSEAAVANAIATAMQSERSATEGLVHVLNRIFRAQPRPGIGMAIEFQELKGLAETALADFAGVRTVKG